MKKLSLALLASASMLSASWAGSLGPGPWANGAYFPGQFDGVYSASIFGSNALSGVVGFAIKNGTATVLTNSTVSSNSTQNTVSVDPFQNYFVVYIDGITYAGYTFANVNVDKEKVNGSLVYGSGPNTTIAYTNIKIESQFNSNSTNVTQSYENIFQTYQNTAGGAFSADLESKKSIVTFKGVETGVISTGFNGIPNSTNTFSVSGIKVSHDSSSPFNSSTSGSGGN